MTLEVSDSEAVLSANGTLLTRFRTSLGPFAKGGPVIANDSNRGTGNFKDVKVVIDGGY